MFFGVIWI